jgi:uncharacterized short protein YbdD (DUF466 family)
VGSLHLGVSFVVEDAYAGKGARLLIGVCDYSGKSSVSHKSTDHSISYVAVVF